MAAPYIVCDNVTFARGQRTLFANINLAVHPGDRMGIVGSNGSGKTTFLGLLAGHMQPDSGRIARRSDVAWALVAQDFSPEGGNAQSVRTFFHASLPAHLCADHRRTEHEQTMQAHCARLECQPELAEDPAWLEQLSTIQAKLDAIQGVESTNIIESALLLGRLQSLADRQLDELSGGEQKRVQIISTLLQQPQLLLLDEPTNHLDLETVDWLEELLLGIAERGLDLFGRPEERDPVAFVLVSHDRALLDTLAATIVEFDRGICTQYEGNFESYSEQKMLRAAEQERELSSLSNLYRRELAWLRAGVKARTTKQVARIQRAHALSARVGNLKVRTEKREAAAIDFNAVLKEIEREGSGDLIPKIRALGQQELIQIERASVAHPGGEGLICSKLSLVLKPRTRVAIVGPNGSGKSTILRALWQKMGLRDGSINYHDLTTIAYFDQERAALDGNKTVREIVCPKGDYVLVNGTNMHVFGYLGSFEFTTHDAEKRTSELSGGERARLLLARLMLDEANVLILDEPTNDLDIATLQRLEQSLGGFPGATVFTSHDRYFLRRVATHFLVWQGVREGTAQWVLVPDFEQALSILEAETQATQTTSITENTPRTQPEKTRRAFGSKEKREYETIEKEVTKIDAEITAHEKELANLYSEGAPYSATQPIAAQIDKLKQELTAKTARWEELFVLMDNS